MAVFLINICKFNGCGIKFDSLGELITHIENIHIDYDPLVVEQKEQSQPSCLPLSYVLRFITDAARKEGPFLNNTTSSTTDIKRKLAIKHHSYSMSSSNRSNTPTGSEIDDEEMMMSESENSNESWTTEEFSSEFIMRYGSRHSGTVGNSASNEKPFACPVPGCKKRYKNVNGIKYHSKNGHKKEGKVRKGFKCYCGKSYKTSQGLKNHSMLSHNNAPTESLNNNNNINNNNNNATTAATVATSPSTSSSTSISSLSQSRSLSPSSVSGGGSCNSINNQSQLSPITIANNNNNNYNNSSIMANSTIAFSTAMSSPSTVSATAANVVASTLNVVSSASSATFALANKSKPNQTTATIPPSFGLITLKAASTNLIGVNALAVSNTPSNTIISHAISSARNPNKLIKVVPECFDSGALVSAKACGKSLVIGSANNTNNGNILISSVAAIANASNNDDGCKINLPSLVNLGILTPATSPKQHQQQQQQQQHQQQTLQQQTSQVSPHRTSPTSSGAIANSSNDATLPLTPISPNINNKTISFSNTNISSGHPKINSNNLNANSNGLIANANTADNSMTEDT